MFPRSWRKEIQPPSSSYTLGILKKKKQNRKKKPLGLEELMATSQKHGVLYQLEKLEAQNLRSARQQEENYGEQETGAVLKAKILKMRKLRDELRIKVKLQEASARIPITNLEPYEPLKNSEENLEMKLKKAKAFLQAFHLTGISGKLTKQGVCVCFSTAFEGNILDSYYVDLIIQEPLKIHRHSIPVFIPLEQIAAKYLQSDFQRFMFSLSEHLNAYSGRKYQADQLQHGFSAFLARPLQRNSLCTLLTFTYTMDSSEKAFPFCARLVYEDLTRTLPTNVTVTYQGTGATPASWEKQRAAQETLFYKNALPKVFESFLRRETFDCTSSEP
ncbi:centromere protein O isoform X3 [Monodelphis domestica]|uniref:centromere protein O isoform X3 n=2 Tax=Monodelphis domestica TaxID=13616 RepID=UPI0024E1B88A|nr:centromere protein O isoform X3 [Monodelphis domestica]